MDRRGATQCLCLSAIHRHTRWIEPSSELLTIMREGPLLTLFTVPCNNQKNSSDMRPLCFLLMRKPPCGPDSLDRSHSNHHNILLWLRELQHYSFIVMVSLAHYGVTAGAKRSIGG